MVLKPEPVFNAMEDLNRTDNTRVILMCPQGRPFSQAIAQELSEQSTLCLSVATMKAMMNVLGTFSH